MSTQKAKVADIHVGQEPIMRKLSTMPARESAALIAEICVPLSRIAKNDAVQEFFVRYAQKDMTAGLAISGIIEMLPVFLRDNYDDALLIVSTFCGKTVAELDAQNIVQIMKDAKGCFDADLLKLFQ